MRIALAGNPNSGKTTMYNSLTGKSERVGNWAGVTVDKRESHIKKSFLKDNENISVIYLIKDLIDNIFMSDTTIDYNSIKYAFLSNEYLNNDVKNKINKEFETNNKKLIKKLTK